MQYCLACFGERLASVFENASELRFYRVEEDDICPAGRLSLPSKDPKDRTSALLACGASFLVCGGLCGRTRQVLEQSGIRVRPFIRGEVREVLDALRHDRLDGLSMPGCRGRGLAQGMGCGMGLQQLRKPSRPQHQAKGDTPVLIAITCQGETLDSPIDPRFGRAAGFIIYNTEDKSASYVDNGQNLSLPQGAGIQAAQTVSKTGAKAVVTGHTGPKAFMALSQGNIAVFLAPAGTVREAIEAYERGDLAQAEEADKDGHW